MDLHLADAVIAARGPLVTRDVAVAAGLSPRAVDRLVRVGTWVAVRRGVYATPAYVAAQLHRSDRQRLQDDAACLRISRSHVRSHASAAVVLGMQVLLPDPPTTHVTRDGVHGSRHEHGVKHHLAPYDAAQVLVVDGVRVLEPARTALDITREQGLVAGVAAMDAALRLGVRRERLQTAFAQMTCWPGSTLIRAGLERCDAGSDSLAETLGRLMAARLGRGRPQTQFGLSCDGRTAYADLRLGRHLIEIDGRMRYAPGQPRRPDEIWWDEKKRQDWLCGFKLGISRLTWADVWPFGQPAVLARLEREAADTDRRFGTDIADLAPYVVQRRPRRPFEL